MGNDFRIFMCHINGIRESKVLGTCGMHTMAIACGIYYILFFIVIIIIIQNIRINDFGVTSDEAISVAAPKFRMPFAA